MKLLLDENLPHALRADLPDHDAYTVQYLGWGGIKNGALMARAAEAGFEVLITMDRGFAHEHNRAALPLGIVTIVAKSDEYEDLRVLVPKLLAILDHFPPKSIQYIE